MSEGRPLSGHELDDLRNWALSAAEDDAEDEFPPLVLRLLQENAELRELLHREDENGNLDIVAKQAKRIDELQRLWTEEQQSSQRLRDRIVQATVRERTAREQAEKCAAIMLKVERLMAMARENIEGTGAMTPEALSSLATKMEEQYERDKATYAAAKKEER